MGWSCASDAAHVNDAWMVLCRRQTGSQNVYHGKDGATYFYEISRREHSDGAITGTSYRELPNGYARKCGAFRIDGDGTVARFPTAWPFDKAIASRCPTCGELARKGDYYCAQCGNYVFA